MNCSGFQRNGSSFVTPLEICRCLDLLITPVLLTTVICVRSWCSSRLWRRVHSSVDVSVSEKHTVSIFRAAVHNNEAIEEQELQVIGKSRNPFQTRVLFVKNKLYWNQKKKQCYIRYWKCPLRSAMHAFTLYLVFVATRWRVPVSRKRFTRRDIVDLFHTG
jgi:hypothetical protein